MLVEIYSYAKFMPIAVEGNRNVNTMIGNTIDGSNLTPTFTITFDEGNQIIDYNQNTHNIEDIKKFKIVNTYEGTHNINLSLKTVINSYANVAYNLYSCSASAYSSVTLANVSTNCSSVKSGTLSQGPSIQKLHPNNYMSLTGGSTNYYVLYLNTVSYSNSYYGYVTASTYESNTLANAIIETYPPVADNIASTYVSSATGIDFAQKNSPTNGQGLYINVKNGGDGTIKYFRGGTYCAYTDFDQEYFAQIGQKCIAAGGTWVNYVCSLSDSELACANAGFSYYTLKNNVMFGGYAWKIIRINSNGTIRMIYNGTSPTVRGTNVGIGTAYYNNSTQYVPGTPGTAYETAAKNYASYANTDSTSLAYKINAWYSNLSSVASKISDEEFCSDTTWGTISSSKWEFASLTRKNNGTPTFECPTSETYTVINGKLANPIATINADEAIYAGAGTISGSYIADNYTFYLHSGFTYHTMSPDYWYKNNGAISAFSIRYSTGGIGGGLSGSNYVNSSIGARPVINLKANVTVSDGDGSLNNPWIVD